ncbi:Protein required for fusion of vesicles in vesicular transport, alpha-SNAP [Phaffia rhodozyma]|uniref:Protein required for fusion of vesicles in vesicular transport, alpha-SNAP n=1 Tax=Phaffia rhodozyma TaxID=264483 RepID=A0A0F7SHM4_PHARH|nr:Protein required for fusion of vesicles in vesicular transport, alpha-SNAP [Phaffia rhodozyma]
MAPSSVDLLAKANKKASSSTGWFSSSSTKFEEAADLFQQAANAFKLEKNWDSSGRAFDKEGECRLKANEKDDAIAAFWNASKSFKQSTSVSSVSDAVNALTQAITLLTEQGRFRQAADRQKEVGNILKESDLPAARDAFEKAGEWYQMEDAQATGNAILKEAAEISGSLGDYKRAVDTFVQVGNWSLSSPLTKYSVKEIWLKAGLCALGAEDVVLARNLLDKFAQQDVTFPSTREARFLNNIVIAYGDGDVEAFTAHVVEYDQVTKLDNWKTEILLRIKKTIGDEGGLA